MIWTALGMVGWEGWVLLVLTALCLSAPICFLWDRYDDRRLAEDAAAYAEFMRVRRL